MEAEQPQGYVNAKFRHDVRAAAANSRPHSAVVQAPPVVRPMGEQEAAFTNNAVYVTLDLATMDMSWLVP